MSRRSNLLKLALYLAKKRPSRNFSMSTYADIKDSNVASLAPYEVKAYPQCKTVCCALGHGQYAGIPIGKAQTWEAYALKFVYPGDRTAESWFFAYSWTNTDNTPKGAAYRIGYYLATGSVPDWFSSSRNAEFHMEDYKKCIRIGREYLKTEALKRGKAQIAKLAREANIGLK
jgi:hypothetical protein